MDTLILGKSDVARLLNLEDCMTAVEHAFRLHAEGKAFPPKILGLQVHNGGFHIKAGLLEGERNYFVAKVNGNFPGNPKEFNLPTIQGIVLVCDAENGRVLALMDSIEITITRTGAATGIAAKYLSLPNASVVTICGCGLQGKISLRALMKVRPVEKVFAFDIDSSQVAKFIHEFGSSIEVNGVDDKQLSDALKKSQIVVTCTPSKQPFICKNDIRPGTFIAAVGADSEEKQELFSDLLVPNKIVADLFEQSITIGEAHHAIRQGLMDSSAIYGELGSVIEGSKRGRESDKEIIIFDSTGMALQDAASASLVFEKAIASGDGITLNLFK